MKLKNNKNARTGQIVTGPDHNGNIVTGMIVSIDEKAEVNNIGLIPVLEPQAFGTASRFSPAKEEPAED